MYICVCEYVYIELTRERAPVRNLDTYLKIVSLLDVLRRNPMKKRMS